MTEQMTIAERYMTARTTTSLKVKTGKSAADILAAAGMAGQKHDLPLRLWAFMHDPKPSDFRYLCERLAVKAEAFMFLNKHKGKPREIARQALAWWAFGVCKHCDGLGFERIPGTPHLSDVTCSHCDGTGRQRLHTGNDEVAKWLVVEIDAMTTSATVAIKSRIG